MNDLFFSSKKKKRHLNLRHYTLLLIYELRYIFLYIIYLTIGSQIIENVENALRGFFIWYLVFNPT